MLNCEAWINFVVLLSKDTLTNLLILYIQPYYKGFLESTITIERFFWEFQHYNRSFILINGLLSVGALHGYRDHTDYRNMLKILCFFIFYLYVCMILINMLHKSSPSTTRHDMILKIIPVLYLKKGMCNPLIKYARSHIFKVHQCEGQPFYLKGVYFKIYIYNRLELWL